MRNAILLLVLRGSAPYAAEDLSSAKTAFSLHPIALCVMVQTA